MQGRGGVFPDLVDDPQPGFLIDGPALSRIGTDGLSAQPLVSALRVGIPPCLDGAIRVVKAVFSGPGARGSAPQALGERHSLLAQGFDVADDLKAQKREAFFGCWCWDLHGAAVFAPPCARSNKTVLWSGFLRLQAAQTGTSPRAQCACRLR